MKQLRLPVIATLLLLLISSSAFADIAFTVVDSNFQSGKLGTAAGTRVRPGLVSNLNGDPAVFSFTAPDNSSRLLVANRSSNPQVNDTVWIYDPNTSDWKRPIKEAAWSMPKNIHGATSKGQHLFLAAYNTLSANGKIVRVNLNTYEQEKEYTHPSASEGYIAHAEAVVTVGNYIYTLFSYSKDPWGASSYKSSKLVKTDLDLNPVSTVDVGKNAVHMLVHAGKIYIVSHGGKQDFQNGLANAESRIERVDPASMATTVLLKVEDLFFGEANDPKDEFQDIAFSPDGTVYILAGTYRGNASQFCGGVYKSSIAELNSNRLGEKKVTLTNLPGFSWNLKWDESTRRLWCVFDQLVSYNGDLRDQKTYTDSELGGNIYALATYKPTSVPPHSNDQPGSGGSSGCSTGGIGLMIPALLALSLFTQKRRARG